jgi:hypothetical protein
MLEASREADAREDEVTVVRSCPDCGFEEEGYFCRQCGSLIHGGGQILCPRCHQVVPSGEFCNQCGQLLRGIALRLRQLALAGEEFWVTSEVMAIEESLAGRDEEDDTLELAQGDFPDWLQEIPVRSVEGRGMPRIHPSLEPIATGSWSLWSSRALILVAILMFILMVGLAFLALAVLRGGGG